MIIVSGVADDTRIAAAIEAGAVGYLPKNRPLDELVQVVASAAAGDSVLAEAERFRLLGALRRCREQERQRQEPFSRLTPRETQVLNALADGMSVDTIAREWVVSEATVRTQVRGVLTKLGVSSQLAAVAVARQAGWLERTVDQTA